MDRRLALLAVPAALVVLFLILMCPSTDADQDVARIGNVGYASVEDALSAAVSGDTVYIIADCEITSDITVEQGIKLVLPYDCYKEYVKDNPDSTPGTSNARFAGSEFTKLTVTVQDAIVTVKGELCIGGILSKNFAYDYNSHTSGDHAVLSLKGSSELICKSGSKTYCYGYIRGEGKVTLESGSFVQIPFVVTDFIGGDFAKVQVEEGQSPFNRYTVRNIESVTTAYSGSTVRALVKLYANKQINTAEFDFISSSGDSLVKLDSGKVVLSYNGKKYLKSNWESNIWGDVGKTTLTVYGKVSIGHIRISAMGRTIDTANVIFSIPYNFDFVFMSGSQCDMGYKFRIMPGSVWTVKQGASINILSGAEVYFYDGFKDHTFRDKYYPGTDVLSQYKFSSIGRLIVNGTLTIKNGAKFCGLVETTSDTGKIVTEKGSILKSTVSYGTDRSGMNNMTTRDLSARVCMKNGIVDLSADMEYRAVDGSSHVLESFTYTDNIDRKTETVTIDQNVSGTWQVRTFNILSSASEGGSISPAGNNAIPMHFSRSFEIKEQTGYRLKDLSVDGTSVGRIYYYTFNDVTSDHTIQASFELIKYHMTVSISGIGTATPMDAYCEYGTSCTFTFTPSEGYRLSDVSIDGKSVGSTSPYTITNISSNHMLSVTFQRIPYTVEATAGEGGSISPSGPNTVYHGDSITFWFSPSTGHRIQSVYVDGANMGEISSYTFSNVREDHRINVTFAKLRYNVTASVDGSGGTISPSGSMTAEYGDKVTFRFTPSRNHEIDRITVNGSSVSVKDEITLTITSDTNVAVRFIGIYHITASAGSNGKIYPDGETTVREGGSLSVSIVPDTGYTVSDVTVDGRSVGTVTFYSFDNVKEDHRINVTFAKLRFNVTSSVDGTGGSVSPSGTRVMEYGDSITFRFTPSKNYGIDRITVNGSSVQADDELTLTVTSEISLVVKFIRIYSIAVSSGPNGTTVPDGTVSVKEGKDLTVDIRPSIGYTVSDVNVDGTSVGEVTSYTFKDVREDHSLSVTFEIIRLEVTTTAGTGGSITIIGEPIVDYGGTTEILITAEKGHVTSGLFVNDGSVTITDDLVLDNITVDTKVRVEFMPFTEVITDDVLDEDTVDWIIEQAENPISKGMDPNINIITDDHLAISSASVSKLADIGYPINIDFDIVSISIPTDTLSQSTDGLEISVSDDPVIPETFKDITQGRRVFEFISADPLAGSVHISIPYEQVGAKDSFVYLNTDTGKIEELNYTYKDGLLECDLQHFSLYSLVTIPDPEPASDSDPVVPIIAGVIIIVLIAAVAVLLWLKMRSRKV